MHYITNYLLVTSTSNDKLECDILNVSLNINNDFYKSEGINIVKIYETLKLFNMSKNNDISMYKGTNVVKLKLYKFDPITTLYKEHLDLSKNLNEI